MIWVTNHVPIKENPAIIGELNPVFMLESIFTLLTGLNYDELIQVILGATPLYKLFMTL